MVRAEGKQLITKFLTKASHELSQLVGSAFSLVLPYELLCYVQVDFGEMRVKPSMEKRNYISL